MKNIVIFASGSGTNAQKIAEYFLESEEAKVVGIYTNNKKAGVIERARKLGLPCVVFSKEELVNGTVLNRVKYQKADLIVLAGFLKKIPEEIIEEFPNRIVNLHPALLPDYGGEGMYGMNVHQAVVDNEEEETGITIHFVNENYDDGEIIFQETVDVDPEDTPEDVAYKVQQLEHMHYPAIIEWVLRDME